VKDTQGTPAATCLPTSLRRFSTSLGGRHGSLDSIVGPLHPSHRGRGRTLPLVHPPPHLALLASGHATTTAIGDVVLARVGFVAIIAGDEATTIISAASAGLGSPRGASTVAQPHDRGDASRVRSHGRLSPRGELVPSGVPLGDLENACFCHGENRPVRLFTDATVSPWLDTLLLRATTLRAQPPRVKPADQKNGRVEACGVNPFGSQAENHVRFVGGVPR
jgi:hypothetical protein